MDFFTSPASSLGVAIAALLLVIGYRFARPASAHGWLAFAGYAGAIIATFLASRGALPGPAVRPGAALRLAGAAVLVLGLLLTGSAASARLRAPPGKLVTSGPYRRVRHPSTLGLALVLLGFLARAPSLAGGAAVLLAVILLASAALREERAARRRFGPEWDAYAARAGALFPRREPRA